MSRTVDVLVAGAGPAGIAAALAAARAGARVLVVEAMPFPGGMGSAAQVHTFCGLYRPDSDTPAYANNGLASELPARLVRAGAAATEPVRMGRLWVLPHDPARYAREAEKWLAAGLRIEVRFSTRLTAAETACGLVRSATLAGGERREAGAFVDCTGDATLAALAGAETRMEESARLQRPAVILRLAGLPGKWTEAAGRLTLAASIVESVRNGLLPSAALGAAFRAGMDGDTVWCTIDLRGGDAWDPLDEAALTALAEAGGAVGEALRAHLARVTGAPVRVTGWPPRPGVRESRRIVGDHILTGEEVLGGTRFADEIAEITWPMEFRETAAGPRFRWPQRPGGIPLRSLRARGFSNLFAAGRCLSCDHEAQAAIRVMGLCLATGDAAGRAAATL